MKVFFSNIKIKIRELSSRIKVKKPKNLDYIILVVIFLLSVSGVVASLNQKGDILGGKIFGRQIVEEEEKSSSSESEQPFDFEEEKIEFSEGSDQQDSPLPSIEPTKTPKPGPDVQGVGSSQDNPSSDSPGQLKKTDDSTTSNPPAPQPPEEVGRSDGGGSEVDCDEFEHGKKEGECKPGGGPN